MTTCERGDVILLNLPLFEDLEMRARPAVVLHDCSILDPRISIAPLTPDPMVDCNSILVSHGSFEAARMGLITSAYLNAVEEILVDRHFLLRKLGRCPHRLFKEFLASYRVPLGFRNTRPMDSVDTQRAFSLESHPYRRLA